MRKKNMRSRFSVLPKKNVAPSLLHSENFLSEQTKFLNTQRNWIHDENKNLAYSLMMTKNPSYRKKIKVPVQNCPR